MTSPPSMIPMTRLLLILILLISLPKMSWRPDYYRGMGAYKKGDYATALCEFGPLVGEGHARAQTMYTKMLAQGLGIRKDDREATYWYEREG